MTPSSLTSDQLAFYHEHGYLQYGRLLDDSALEELRGIADRLYTEANKGSIELATGQGTYSNFTPVFTREPRYAELLFRNPVLLEVLESILGPVFRLVEDQLFYKPANHGAPLAFHHDNVYYGFTDPKIVTCWIALDDATPDNGCLELCPGSHRMPIEHESIPGTIIKEAVIDMEQVIAVPAKAGELVLLDGLTVHGSGPNTTDRPRRVANLVVIIPCADGVSLRFCDEGNPYLRGAPVNMTGQ